MPVPVLITQCLQNDFVGPISAHEALPNLLHVGHAEALRLLGPNPSEGPVSQLMAWARAQTAGALHVLHIRDWHDPHDEAQRDHLAMFGSHCVKETPGATLVLHLESGMAARPNERMVNAIALNDFEGTTLAAELERIRQTGDGELRVGVIGAWTEAKVSFLLYDLKTRCQIHSLATCSALTASASRSQHFNALEQLRRILGVQCFDSVGELESWLLPQGTPFELTRAGGRFGAQVHVDNGAPLSAEDEDVVRYLFRDSSEVRLRMLTGGFSGAGVFQAKSRDALGHQQAPSVVKLGPQRMIGTERVGFERVQEILGNNVPSVRGFVDLGARAGIKYSYASMGHGDVRTLKSLFDSNAPVEVLERHLREVFEEIWGPLYAAARQERLSVLAHYGFAPSWAASVRENMRALIGDRVNDDRLTFAGLEVANVCHFYERFLPSHAATLEGESHYVAYVHGDLNAANVLVDGRQNLWIIDFFHTAPGHVLKDLAKLENDLLYVLTPITEDELPEALRITCALRSVIDLREPLPEQLEGLRAPALVRAWRILQALREMGGALVHEDRNPLQLSVALLRYTVQTLTFAESSPVQKQWALAAACAYAEDIERTYEQNRALRVDWLDPSTLDGAAIGMTLCPGRRDRGRELDADLDALIAQGTRHLVALLTDDELAWAGVADLGARARAKGLVFHQLAIKDQSVPSLADAHQVVGWILDAAKRSESVVLHCLGGLGRTGTLAACVLVECGMSPAQAIAEVRAKRSPRALETVEQENFVSEYSAWRRAARA